jgi:hypothetical protein
MEFVPFRTHLEKKNGKLSSMVPEAGIEPTWAQGPGNFELGNGQIKPPPYPSVLEKRTFPRNKLKNCSLSPGFPS